MAKCMTGLEKYSRPILREQDQERQRTVSSGLQNYNTGIQCSEINAGGFIRRVEKLARPGTWSDHSDKSLSRPGRRFPRGRCRPIDFSVESLYCVCSPRLRRTCDLVRWLRRWQFACLTINLWKNSSSLRNDIRVWSLLTVNMECYNVPVTRARRNWKVPGRQHVAATGGRIATFQTFFSVQKWMQSIYDNSKPEKPQRNWPISVRNYTTGPHAQTSIELLFPIIGNSWRE